MKAVDRKLFYPDSVALIGSSDQPGSVGDNIRKNLIASFQGKIFHINPRHKEVAGTPTASSIDAIGDTIDLAIIAIPAPFVADSLRQVIHKGVPAAVIISAGFKESGDDGVTREKEIEELSESSGISLIGPNCLGIMNPEIGLNATFASQMPDAGVIAFVTQSGALGTSVLDYAKEMGIGFSKFISIGNKASVDEVALLTYLNHDPATRVILMYLEDIKDAASFIKTGREVSNAPNPKPIILLKAGTTAEGARASSSHTGALGGNDAYYEALTRQSNTIRVHSIADMLASAVTFAHNPLPQGNHVGIITNAGGPGILMTDEAVHAGLELSQLSDTTATALSSSLTAYASVKNPVDILGDAKASQYQAALDLVSKDADVHSMLALLTPQSGTEIVETANVFSAYTKEKPLVVSFMGGNLVAPGVSILRKNRIAVTEYPEEAARALSRLTNFAITRSVRREAFPTFAAGSAEAEKIMSELDTREHYIPERQAGQILRAYGFPMLATVRAMTVSQVIEAVTQIGKPCALKIVSRDITHKRDVGGVELNVTPQTAEAAYDRLMTSVREKAPSARIDGVMVVEMAPLGLECILGMVRQPNFGTMVMVGMGGTYVEVTKDVSFGILPIDKTDAKMMISSLHAHKLFAGYRGSPALDTEALIGALNGLAALANDHPDIEEIDINPFMLYPKGAGGRVVDVRMIRRAS